MSEVCFCGCVLFWVPLLVGTFITCVVLWILYCPESNWDNDGVHTRGCVPAILAVLTGVPVVLLVMATSLCLLCVLLFKLTQCAQYLGHCQPREYEVV